MDIYEMVVKAAEKGLEALGKTKNKNIKGNQLLEWILNNKDQFDFNVELIKVSWGAYLTRAILDPETKIAREPGKYSLILDNKKSEIVQESLTDEESNPTAKPGNIEQQSPDRQKREEILYNLLAEWLSLQKYNAEVRADSRKGCKWGNPDIVGIMLVDDPLGRQQIEIGTIEAKISLADWRKEFFEAVSHKRFSNRSYFAFAIGANRPIIDKNTIPYYEELRKYGEKYNVGILVVFLVVINYNKLTKENISGLNLTLDNVVINEIWPAIYEYVSPNDMYCFVKDILELDSSTEVNSFGTYRNK